MTSFSARRSGAPGGVSGAWDKRASWTKAQPNGKADRCYLIVSIGLIAVMSAIFIWIAPAEHDFVDYWEHAAAIKQLMASPIHPLHPQYATHDGSRQYMPWFLALALLGRLFQWSPFTVLTFGSIVTAILSLAGIRAFFLEYFGNRWAPMAGLVSLFFMWGRPWIWSSFYSLRSFLTTAAYPSTFVLALTFLIWWMGLRALRSPSLRVGECAALTGMAALALLVHQLSGMFAVAGLACFLVAERSHAWQRKAILLGTIVLAGAAVHFWPYFDPWQMANGNQLWNPQWTGAAAERFYRAHDVLVCIGPAIVGIIALVWFVKTKAYPGTVLGCAGAAMGYGVGGLLHNPVSHRVLIVVILYLHIAMAWLLLAIFGAVEVPERKFMRRWRRWVRAAAGGAIAAVIIAQTGVIAAELADQEIPNSVFAHLPIRHRIEIRQPLEQLSMHLSPGSIAMASDEASMILPAFKGRVVSVYRASPLVPDDGERDQSAERFFSPTTSRKERRAIVAHYGVTHVFYWPGDFGDQGAPSFIEEIAQETDRAGGFVLVKIDQSKLALPD